MAAIVIGVSHMPGVGFAVAKKLAAEGLKVGIVGRQKERLDRAKDAIEESVPGAQIAIAIADATVGEVCTECVH